MPWNHFSVLSPLSEYRFKRNIYKKKGLRVGGQILGDMFPKKLIIFLRPPWCVSFLSNNDSIIYFWSKPTTSMILLLCPIYTLFINEVYWILDFALFFNLLRFVYTKKKYLFNLMGFLSFRPVCVLLSFVLYCNFRYFFFFLLFRSFRQVFFVSSNVNTIYKSIFILSFVTILLLITQHHWFYLGLFQCYFMYYSI